MLSFVRQLKAGDADATATNPPPPGPPPPMSAETLMAQYRVAKLEDIKAPHFTLPPPPSMTTTATPLSAPLPRPTPLHYGEKKASHGHTHTKSSAKNISDDPIQRPGTPVSTNSGEKKASHGHTHASVKTISDDPIQRSGTPISMNSAAPVSTNSIEIKRRIKQAASKLVNDEYKRRLAETQPSATRLTPFSHVKFFKEDIILIHANFETSKSATSEYNRDLYQGFNNDPLDCELSIDDQGVVYDYRDYKEGDRTVNKVKAHIQLEAELKPANGLYMYAVVPVKENGEIIKTIADLPPHQVITTADRTFYIVKNIYLKFILGKYNFSHFFVGYECPFGAAAGAIHFDIGKVTPNENRSEQRYLFNRVAGMCAGSGVFHAQVEFFRTGSYLVALQFVAMGTTPLLPNFELMYSKEEHAEPEEQQRARQWLNEQEQKRRDIAAAAMLAQLSVVAAPSAPPTTDAPHSNGFHHVITPTHP